MSRTPVPPPSTRRERREQARQDRPERRRTTYRTKQRPAWQSPMVLISAAAVVVAGVVIVLNVLPKSWKTSELATPPTAYAADLTDGETLGRADAKVTMEIYADFQCPACDQLVTTQLQRYVTDFVKPGTLKIVARDIDILGRGNSASVDLAIGARCAGEQDRYWQFHDAAFWNQQPENSPNINASFIESLASLAEVDMAKWKACIGRADVRQAIEDATAQSRKIGIQYTPTIILNGQIAAEGVPQYDTVAAKIRAAAGLTSPAPSTASPAASPATSTAP